MVKKFGFALSEFICNYVSIFTSTLGEDQDTGKKRIVFYRNGYLCGSPDLIINNLQKKHHTGFATEYKNSKGIGVLSYDQSKMLQQYKNNGFKTLVSNDYDYTIEQLIEYFKDIRIKCLYCQENLFVLGQLKTV